MSLFRLPHLSQTSRRLFHTTRRAEVPYRELVRTLISDKTGLQSFTTRISEDEPDLPEPIAVFSAGPSRPKEHYLQFPSADASHEFVDYVSTHFPPDEAKATVARNPRSHRVSTKVVFVRELPIDITWDQKTLKAYFAKFGAVKHVQVNVKGL